MSGAAARSIVGGLACLAVLASLGAAQAQGTGAEAEAPHQGPPFARMLPVVAQHGMAVTEQPLATQVALDVLKAGGNAVDAAIAANAATAFLLPMNNGLGGDLFALVWIAEDERLYGLNASGRSPLGTTLEQLREAVGDADTIPLRGPLAALTVPGAVDGWFELHDRWGSLPMADLLAPAIRYAREGAPGEGWSAREQLAAQPGFADTFLPGGEGPRRGQLFRNPRLANTLERIAAGGRDAFYRGEIAEAVDRFCRRVGCLLRFEDFVAHESEWVDPLGVTFEGYTVWQLPPNSQGLALLQMLQILEPFDLRSMGHNSAAYLHHLIEAKKLAYEDRARFYADPLWVDIPVMELLADEYIERRRRLLNPGRAAAAFPPDDPRINRKETTYVTVADSRGNMVSLIQSNFGGPGSGLTPDGLGFGLQNRGAAFSLERGHPNVFEPGKRPFHTLIPGFITRQGRAYMSFATTGGDMQPQASLQAFLNHVLFGMDVQAAGDAARFRHYGSSDPRGSGRVMRDGGCVALETELIGSVRAQLEAMGHVSCEPGTMVGGRYFAIRRDEEEGVYWGAVESRVYGQAAGW